jgi:GAF domain-containing protein
MPRLPDTWIAHLDSGVSLRIAACTAAGQPLVRRALAVRVLADGRFEVLLARRLGTELLDAVRHSRQVALSVGHPQTNRTLQVKGRDAEVARAQARQQAFFEQQRDAFVERVATFGFARERLESFWFGHSWRELDCIRFTPSGAWDQTPGIGAGGTIELLEEAMTAPAASAAHAAAPAAAALQDAAPDDADDHEAQAETPAAAAAAAAAAGPAAPLPLRDARVVLDGIIPPSMATASSEGVPHVTFLSHAEYVDDSHVALTYQFFNRSRAIVMATGRAALMVECPYSGATVVMQLRYQRTEAAGPVFERLRAKLAGIAAHTGMEKVFRLLGADIYRVESIVRNDLFFGTPPGKPPRCDVATGARALAARLAEVSELPRLVPAFMEGLREQLRIDHAILWMLDETREGLYTLASLGYADSGVGSELALADAGLAGVALREGVPIRIGHMASMYRYGLAWRERAEGVGLQAVIARSIPLPGLARPGSQLAVPLRARGRSVGVLLVETDIEQQTLDYDHEDALALLGGQLAQAMAALQVAEIDAAAPRAAQRADEPAAPSMPSMPSMPSAPAARVAAVAPAPVVWRAAGTDEPATQPAPLVLRHWARDHTVFAGEDYLIKGVAGAILWRLATEQVQRGRSEFTTRELRLAGGDLGLPEVQDNLGVRLLLLERRLAERDCGIHIERTGRGRFRFASTRPLQLQEEAGGAGAG